MPGPATATLLDAFAGLEAAPAIVLAVSGGGDSMALVRVAAAWAGYAGRPALHVATVDHALRPESASEARRVAGWAGDLGLSHATLVWQGPKPAASLQAAAREVRYALLEAHAAVVGATHVLTAHHAGDQAETVLMRLMRGSGPAGLAGMRRERPLGRVTLVRPFLDTPRAALRAVLEETGQSWIEDPSNIDPRYTRTLVRRSMPLLAAGGLTEDRLARLAGRLSRLDAVAARAAARAAADLATTATGRTTLAAGLFGEPEETQVRVLAAALQGVAGSPMPPRLLRVEALAAALACAFAEGRAVTRTAGGCIVRLRHGEVTIVREAERTRGRGARSRPANTDAVR